MSAFPSEPRISAIDRELLVTLERAFEQHAGSDALIDAADLQRALGLRSEYLARRVLAAFDSDASGKIDRKEFLRAVRALVFGSERDKLRFAFRLHDDDGDGSISQLEMLRMISIGLAENDVVSRKSQPPERIAAAVIKLADTDSDGRISFAEFEAVMLRHPELLQMMTRAEALWIAPNEDLLARLSGEPRQAPARLRRFLENRWADALLVGLWLASNVALFGARFFAGSESAHDDVRVRVGAAFGVLLSANGALIFVPVLRSVFTRVRRSWLGHKLAVDRAVDVHRWLGQWLAICSLAHGVAFAAAYRHGHAGLSLWHLFAATLRGSTGALLLGVFAVMWLFAQEPIRRSRHFELFYFTHLAYVAWVALLIVHAPVFAAWAALPLTVLGIEQVRRLRQRARSTTLRAAQALRSGVTRLELARPAGFTFNAGDFVFLNLPHIAKREWHPFTLSSAPERDALTIHVRSLGNWTAALRRDVESTEGTADAAGRASRSARIDGPYGSASAHIFSARCAVLIGAGIGVTPFASVLEAILLRSQGASEHASQLEAVHFFWLNRDQYAFEWFAALLEQLERQDHRQLLDLHICMTGGRSGATAAGLEIAREVLHAQGERDLITGLRTKTHMGHPDWELVLTAIVEQHGREAVEVFFCGPLGLGHKLRKLCARLGLAFHEEKF
jgi:predicted ferric reductase/Ca2+-binding EF-hand superfamily protein